MPKKAVLTIDGKEYHTTEDVLRRFVALTRMELVEIPRKMKVDEEVERFIEVIEGQAFH
jgi:hypothetical protein